MTLSHDHLRTLDALFHLATGDVPATALRLAEQLGASPTQTRAMLGALAQRGLADADRCRLTFAGLAIAAGRARAHAAPRLVRAA
jgi:Mn-dependent DtxR family transcriptional regulator